VANLLRARLRVVRLKGKAPRAERPPDRLRNFAPWKFYHSTQPPPNLWAGGEGRWVM